ncbi:hypothetical protein [Aeromicrobium halocynthiae]|uniref:hypothetical protein n=1 Tax=Aeromicrobium halocynthiae TaxID=560557 RepID=UPI0031DE8449
MSTYRVDRAHVAVLSGVVLIVSSVTALLAFVLASRVLGTMTVVLLVFAALMAVRPPVVARLDDHGLRSRRLKVLWADVTGVRTADGQLVLQTDDGERRLSLTAVGRRRRELLAEVRERMNDSRGYTPWDPSAPTSD